MTGNTTTSADRRDSVYVPKHSAFLANGCSSGGHPADADLERISSGWLRLYTTNPEPDPEIASVFGGLISAMNKRSPDLAREIVYAALEVAYGGFLWRAAEERYAWTTDSTVRAAVQQICTDVLEEQKRLAEDPIMKNAMAVLGGANPLAGRRTSQLSVVGQRVAEGEIPAWRTSSVSPAAGLDFYRLGFRFVMDNVRMDIERQAQKRRYPDYAPELMHGFAFGVGVREAFSTLSGEAEQCVTPGPPGAPSLTADTNGSRLVLREKVGQGGALIEIFDETEHFWSCDLCDRHQYGGLRMSGAIELCMRCVREQAASSPNEQLAASRRQVADGEGRADRLLASAPRWRIRERREARTEAEAMRQSIQELKAAVTQPGYRARLAQEIAEFQEIVRLVKERFGPQETDIGFAGDVDGGRARYWLLRGLEGLAQGCSGAAEHWLSDEQESERRGLNWEAGILQVAKNRIAKLKPEHLVLQELATLGFDSGTSTFGYAVREQINSCVRFHADWFVGSDANFEKLLHKLAEGARWDAGNRRR